MSLPDGRLVSFYGDDFTGSAAVMEVLTFAGLTTVLFLDTPTRGAGGAVRRLSRHRHRRRRAGAEPGMDGRRTFPMRSRRCDRLKAPIAHYKVCSTFDSAPHVGSIGKAIDLAAPVLGGDWHPLLVAAPPIHRYQLFGNLFATVDGVGYRLDRHPTVSRHPMTPMDEADVRVHLAQQTARPIGLVDYLALTAGEGRRGTVARARAGGAEIVAIDVIDEASLAEAGRLIWENRGERLFVDRQPGRRICAGRALARGRADRRPAAGRARPTRRASPPCRAPARR